MSAVIQVIEAADGSITPHDGRYVASWDPHTRYGICKIVTTSKLSAAKRFADLDAAIEEYRTVSRIEPKRPTDGKPNRPLTGLTIEVIGVEDAAAADA
jgi:hypothetical protein